MHLPPDNAIHKNNFSDFNMYAYMESFDLMHMDPFAHYNRYRVRVCNCWQNHNLSFWPEPKLICAHRPPKLLWREARVPLNLSPGYKSRLSVLSSCGRLPGASIPSFKDNGERRDNDSWIKGQLLLQDHLLDLFHPQNLAHLFSNFILQAPIFSTNNSTLTEIAENLISFVLAIIQSEWHEGSTFHLNIRVRAVDMDGNCMWFHETKGSEGPLGTNCHKHAFNQIKTL